MQSAAPFVLQEAPCPPAPDSGQYVNIFIVAMSVAAWHPSPVTLQPAFVVGSQFCEHIFAFGTMPPMPSLIVK